MFSEFRQFVNQGNAIDLAVGVMIGAAFGKIVNSLVADIIMPVLGLALGRVNFANRYISLNGDVYPTLAAARATSPNRLPVLRGPDPGQSLMVWRRSH